MLSVENVNLSTVSWPLTFSLPVFHQQILKVACDWIKV